MLVYEFYHNFNHLSLLIYVICILLQEQISPKFSGLKQVYWLFHDSCGSGIQTHKFASRCGLIGWQSVSLEYQMRTTREREREREEERGGRRRRGGAWWKSSYFISRYQKGYSALLPYFIIGSEPPLLINTLMGRSHKSRYNQKAGIIGGHIRSLILTELDD